MEHHHKSTSSRDISSFPSTPSPDQDSDFEFGGLTPDSPSTDPFKTSPADHLFYNGRLLPHSFPLQQQPISPTTMALIDNICRASSRTGRVNSKDSLMSSRSNSVNSSRSSGSTSGSSRTSCSSENSERRLLYRSRTRVGSRSSSSSSTPMASKVVMAQLYGSSQRWQHIMPVPPVLKREDSRRKNSGGVLRKQGLVVNKREGDYQDGKKNKSGVCRRFFRSLLEACRECHAMEPATKDDILQGS